MNTNTNNTTASVLSVEETNTLFAGSDLIVEDSLKNLADTIGGNTIQHTAFDVQGKRTRIAFVKEFGTDLSDITSLEAALKLSGLDFTAELSQMYDIEKVPGKPPRFVKCDGHFNVKRTDTGETIGYDVGEDYPLYQNRESFEFLDSLVTEGDAKFSTATMFGGSVRGRKKVPNGAVMICMELPETMILNDNYTPYLMFRNSFDRTVSFTCSFVTMRVFCANAINRALKGATNTVSLRHSKTMRDRVEMARMILMNNHKYLDALKAQSEMMALKPFSENDFYAWVQKLVPISEIAIDRVKRNAEAKRNELMVAYRQPDLDNFGETAYRAIQAISDYESHIEVVLRGGTVPGSFKNIVEKNMPILNKTWDMLLEAV